MSSCVSGSSLSVCILIQADQTHISHAGVFFIPRVATGPARCPHVINGNYLSLCAGIMIYNYNNEQQCYKNAQPGAGTLVNATTRSESRFCNPLCLYLIFCLRLSWSVHFLPVGVPVGRYSSDWVPSCKTHTHSCLSAPSIWHNEETQGHHSCSLSVWLSL